MGIAVADVFLRIVDEADEAEVACLGIFDEGLVKGEVNDFRCVADVETGAIAGDDTVADADVILVVVGDVEMLGDALADACLEALQIDLGALAKLEHEAVSDVGEVVLVVRDAELVAEEERSDVFGRVGHLAILERIVDDVVDTLRQGAEDARASHDDLFADTHEQVGVAAEGVVEQVEVLDHDAALALQQRADKVGDLVHLHKGHLEADVEVIGGGVLDVVERVAHLHDLARIDDVVIVGELQAGEHALDEGRFASAGVAEDADEAVVEEEVAVADLFAEEHESLFATRREVLRRDHIFLCVIAHRSCWN